MGGIAMFKNFDFSMMGLFDWILFLIWLMFVSLFILELILIFKMMLNQNDKSSKKKISDNSYDILNKGKYHL
jgi:uncharacterized membrane protein